MSLDELEKKIYGADSENLGEKDTPDLFPKPKNSPGEEIKWQNRANDDSGLDAGLKKSVETAMSPRNKKWIIRAGLILGIAAFAAVSYLLYQIFTFKGVSLEAKAPSQILVGVPFDFAVNYSNGSGSLLKGAKLSVALPPELVLWGESADKRVAEKMLGDVGSGTIGEETFKVMALGGNQSSKRVRLSLEYNSPTLGSRFEKTNDADIFIGDSAAELDMQIAEKVLSGEVFDIKLNYKNVSSGDLKNLELHLDYPAGFTFKTASLKPDQGNNVWQLGDLKSGSSNELVIQGSVVSPANSFFEIKARISTALNGSSYDLNQKAKTISVSSAPLSVSVSLNNRTDYTAQAGEKLFYTIAYANNTNVGFRDVVIRAKLTGEMFDYQSLRTDGALNSNLNVITWSASAAPELTVLDPGKSGQVQFVISTKNIFPATRFSDKNYSLKIDAEIESPTVPAFLAADKTASVGNLVTKVTGLAAINSKLLFRDAGSGILNKGPIPPRVGNPTDYTVHWILKIAGSDMENIEVRANLMAGVKATGVIKSNIDAKPEYNERTQEMVWKIPQIQANRGFLGEPVEAIFQVEATPAINQLKERMPILSETTFQATDSFSKEQVNAKDLPLTTESGDDPTLGPNDGRVTQ